MVTAATGVAMLGVYRGELLESVHRGHAVIVDSAGNVRSAVGDPGVRIFHRSCSKFHQALPVIESGAAARFGFTRRELAVMCSSHQASPEQLREVGSMLEKAGLSEADLRCGAHWPFGKAAGDELIRRGAKPGAIHNNCSGKHAGMLALALHIGAQTDSYDAPNHPVQELMQATLQRFVGSGASLERAIDGCGVPTFATSLADLAKIFALVVSPPPSFPEATRVACRTLVEAAIEFPALVSGDGQIDTEIMRVTHGRLLCKGGAEGLCVAAGTKPSGGEVLGLALKLEDGQSDRARAPVMIEALRQAGLLSKEEAEAIGTGHHTLFNHRGDRVGRVEPLFRF